MSALILCLTLLNPCALAGEMDSSLTVGLISAKTTVLNPLRAVERDFQSLTALMYESLVTLNDSYEPEPCLATSWDISPDYKTWTFHIRTDVFFSDGTQMTAYDVAATVTEILRMAADDTADNKGVYASLKYIVSGAQANNATDLVIKAARPYYGFIYAMTFPVLRSDQVAADNPVGTGPYMADAFSSTDYLYFSVNPYWWGEEPMVQSVSALFYATNRELTSAFEYNRVDAIITRSVTAAQYRAGVSSANIDYRTRQLETLLFNFKSFPLENQNIRYAIRYAIDVNLLANNVYYGMVSRTDTPMPMGTWMYNDGTDTLGDVYAYDPEKAKALLAAEGWADSDGDGILDKVVNGAKKNLQLRLFVYEEAENSVRVEAASQIKDMLNAVGIGVSVSNMSYARAKERLTAGNFDLCLAAFQMDSVPDPGFLLIGPNTGNYGRYKSDAMNSLFKSLRSSTTRQSYQSCLHQIQTLFAQDCPFICLYYRGGAVLTRKIYTNVRDVREPEVLKGIEEIR